MSESFCTAHGRRVADLARGRLDVAASADAERLVVECPACAAWWAEATAAPAEVEAGVSAGFAAFVAPARHRRTRWMVPIAAAAGVAAAVGLGVLLDRGASPASNPVAAMPDAAEVVSVMNFENQSLGVVVGVDDAADASLLVDGMESGDLSSWSSTS